MSARPRLHIKIGLLIKNKRRKQCQNHPPPPPAKKSPDTVIPLFWALPEYPEQQEQRLSWEA